jgi:hypothetical protein
MELVFVLEVPAHPRIISTQTYHSIMILSFLDEADCRLQRILLVILLMQYHNSIRDRHYLLRLAIVDPCESPWKKLYENADATSFLHMTGLTHEAFWALLDYIYLMLRTLSSVADVDGLVQWGLTGISVCCYFIWEAQ